jgi:hypothetical protein
MRRQLDGESSADPTKNGCNSREAVKAGRRYAGPPFLADDLRAWRESANGSPLVFGRNGASWTEDDWRNWRKRKFAVAARAAGVPMKRAYDLRGSIASLWLQEGINPYR